MIKDNFNIKNPHLNSYQYEIYPLFTYLSKSIYSCYKYKQQIKSQACNGIFFLKDGYAFFMLILR